jgi:YfiH family protein
MWNLDRAFAVPLWRPCPAETSWVRAFTTRRGGVSEPPWESLDLGLSTGDRPEAVRENRRRVLAGLGLDGERLVTAGQVHGGVVHRVAQPGHEPACDVLLSLTPDLVLTISTADCMSLLFTAPGAVAAAHAGWRGALAGAPAVAFRALLSAGVPAGAVRVALGPCIRACCYEVGPEVAKRFPSSAVSRVGARLHLDLPAAARLQLVEAGLPPGAFEDTGACTSCESEWYFSHRRDAGRTGRLWGLVALRADGPVHAESAAQYSRPAGP